jgi:hypothetical protein
MFAAIAASCGDDDAAEPPSPPTGTSPAPEPPSAERRGVVLSLDRDSPHPGETVQLTVENRTRERLEYGLAYRLERRTGLGWRWINRDAAFALILLVVEPGKREREEIRLDEDLRPGRYRIVKSFRAPDREIEASVEFTVSGL